MKKRKYTSRVDAITARIYGTESEQQTSPRPEESLRADGLRGDSAGDGERAMLTRLHEIPLADLHGFYARVLATLAHPRLLSPRELAEISGVSMKDIYRLFKMKRLRGWRVPGRKQIKFTLEELLEAMMPVVNE